MKCVMTENLLMSSLEEIPLMVKVALSEGWLYNNRGSAKHQSQQVYRWLQHREAVKKGMPQISNEKQDVSSLGVRKEESRF